MLHLKDISKTYGKTMALRNIDLSIPKGGTTVLIGQSGSGKSTLLRVMDGLIRPDQGGIVLFEGVRVEPENAPVPSA